MTAEERCDKTEMITYACPCPLHRNLKAPTETTDTRAIVQGSSFTATYPGHCAINGDHDIKPGDRIIRVQEEDTLTPLGYACRNCTAYLTS